MSRILMTLVAGLLGGAALWCIVGFTAAQIATKSGAGADGGGAMSGFFLIGGIGGIFGAILGAAVVWYLLGNPARMGTVSGGLLGLFILLAGGIFWAMQPIHVEVSDFPPGKRGEFQVEAKFPQSQMDAVGRQPKLTFELRGGGFFLETPVLSQQIRQDAGRVIVPATFRVKQVKSWILGIMNGELQIAVTDAGMEGMNGTLVETTPWTEWKPIESGLEVRWRFVVLPR